MDNELVSVTKLELFGTEAVFSDPIGVVLKGTPGIGEGVASSTS